MNKNSNPQKIRTLIDSLSTQLLKRYADANLCDQYAWWIVGAITQHSKQQLIAVGSVTFSDAQQEQLDHAIEDLVVHAKPLAYIIGWTPFLDLTIHVKPPLLIPRPETEEWTAHLIELLKSFAHESLSILDLCTGTGCIALALAKAYPSFAVTALDINPIAIEMTQENSVANKISNITCIRSDLFEALEGRTFDLIISNPPYIATEEFETLDETVKLWEDYNALISDDHGLGLVKKIIVQTPAYLHKSNAGNACGNLWIEIGPTQVSEVKEYMRQKNYHAVHSYTDMAHKERVVIGTYEAREASKTDYSSD